MDSDTLAKLAIVQSQLSAELQTLQATLDYISAVENEFTADTLTLEECLAMKELVFNDLPDATTTQGRLAKLTIALSAVSKIVAANQPQPAPVVVPVTEPPVV